MDPCAACGAPAELSVETEYETQLLCVRCFDRLYPNLPIGRLITSFTRPKRSTGRCPYCGWTQVQLDATALMGCPLCYEALEWKATSG